MSDDRYEKPLPTPDALTQPYWDAANEGRLLLQRCASCRRFQFYPRPHCVHCHGMDLDWREASGRGEVYSFTVVHRNGEPGFVDDVPYVLAIVETDEGVRMLSHVVDTEPSSVVVGQRVRVEFVPAAQGFSLPYWTPASD